MKKKWFLLGSVIGVISAVSYIITALFIEQSFSIYIIGIGFIICLLHQFGSVGILYRFAITRHRMSNRLHVYNKLMMIIMIGAMTLHMVILKLTLGQLSEEPKLLSVIVVLIIMFSNIIYQENNTRNFIKKPLFKIKYKQKKAFNQYFGVITSALAILVMWIGILTDVYMDVPTYLFLVLYIIQSSLAYTTYGQSRYWNFTYEVVCIVYVLSIGLLDQNLVFIVAGSLLGILLSYIQWHKLEYNSFSIGMGSVLYVVIGTILYTLNPFVYTYLSDSILVALIIVFGVFGISFFINDPKFYKRLFKS